MKRNSFKIILLVLIFFCLSFIITYPLIFYFNQGIPYSRIPDKGGEVLPLQQGDHLQLYYHFWLAKDALRGKEPFFIDPYEFSVEGMKIFTVRRLPLSILFVVFSVFGGAFAYNLLVILSIIVSGLAMFFLAKLYLQSDYSAMVAALIYALSPFALFQLLGGHTNGFLWGLVPLAIFSLEKLFQTGKLKFGALYLFCLFSFALIEYHLLYYLTLFSLVFLPIRTITSLVGWKKANLKLGKQLLKVWVFIALSLLFVFLFVMFLKNIEIRASIAQKGRRFSEIRHYAPQIKDLFSRKNVDAEKNVYLGIVALLLAIWGLIFGLLRREESIEGYQRKINLLFFTGGLGITAVLALGPSLSNLFPLYDYCYRFIPYFNYPRVPGRIIVVSFLCLAILAGYGVKEIMNLTGQIKKGLLKKIATILLGGMMPLAIFLDYNPHFKIGISLFDEKNKIYELIKEKAGDKKVLELPLWPGDTAWSSIYLYYVTLTRTKIINGYYPLVPQEYVDNIFYPLISLNLGDLTRVEYELLKKLQVKYIIMHEEAFPQKVSHFPSCCSVDRLLESPYLRFITQEKVTWLFELRQEPTFKEEVPKSSWVTGVVRWENQLPHHTGRLIDDSEAENGRALFASIESNSPGHLFFGRQQVFPRGSYKVIFHLKTDEPTLDESIAILDICTDNGGKIIKEKAIKGTDFKERNKYQDFVIDFTQESPLFLEFRLYFLKKANLWFDYLYILYSDQEDPCFHYEAEELYYRGIASFDEEASAGKAILFSPGFRPEKDVLYGPYRRFPPGDYQITFWLKTDKLSDLALAKLEVTTNLSKDKLGEREIKGSDFKKVGIYQSFSFSFKLEREKFLEFRIINYEQENLWADKIEIKPIN